MIKLICKVNLTQNNSTMVNFCIECCSTNQIRFLKEDKMMLFIVPKKQELKVFRGKDAAHRVKKNIMKNDQHEASMADIKKGY